MAVWFIWMGQVRVKPAKLQTPSRAIFLIRGISPLVCLSAVWSWINLFYPFVFMDFFKQHFLYPINNIVNVTVWRPDQGTFMLSWICLTRMSQLWLLFDIERLRDYDVIECIWACRVRFRLSTQQTQLLWHVMHL